MNNAEKFTKLALNGLSLLRPNKEGKKPNKRLFPGRGAAIGAIPEPIPPIGAIEAPVAIGAFIGANPEPIPEAIPPIGAIPVVGIPVASPLVPNPEFMPEPIPEAIPPTGAIDVPVAIGATCPA